MHDQTQAKPSSLLPASLLTSAACCSAPAAQTDGTDDALIFKSRVAKPDNDGVFDLSRNGAIFTTTSSFLAKAHSDWTGGIPWYFADSLKCGVSYPPLARFLSLLICVILAASIVSPMAPLGTLGDRPKTGTR